MIKPVFWMTGLPCSGKSSIARRLAELIPNLAILDGDELREWLSPKDFSREGRIEHNRRVAHLARLLSDHDVPVVVSLISPYKQNREEAKKIIGDAYTEVYVKCPLEVCEARDAKGMYKKARQGMIKNFTGISDPYEEPETPDITIDSVKYSLDDCVSLMFEAYARSTTLVTAR